LSSRRGEVAQHLEEGVMTGGAADVLEIVVLAPRPDALLSGDRRMVDALLLARKTLLNCTFPRCEEEVGSWAGTRGDERTRYARGREIVEKFWRSSDPVMVMWPLYRGSGSLVGPVGRAPVSAATVRHHLGRRVATAQE